MNRIQSINIQRILWCCAEKGVTPADLARDVGIALATLDDCLDGGAGLTFLQLRKIAEYFGRGVLFFLDESPAETDQVHSIQYRTLANTKPGLSYQIRQLIERVERQKELYLSLREELSADDYTQFAAPILQVDDLPRASNLMRDWLGLGSANTFEGYRAAVQAKGILVFRTNGYAGKWQIPKDSSILGFSLYDARCPVIVVRKSISEAQQTFTLMHELGHLLLHKESSIDDEADMQSRQGFEREANAFAGLLLVPRTILDLVQDNERPVQVANYDEWLAPLRKVVGVSNEVILRRLLDSGRLEQERYEAYRAFVASLPVSQDDGGSRAWRHREPKHVFGDTYVRTVLDALSARRITATKASSYLDGIKLSDIHQLERHIAGR